MLQIHAEKHFPGRTGPGTCRAFFMGIVMLLAAATCAAAGTPAAATTDEPGSQTTTGLSADVVWAQFNDGNYQVFLSSYRDGAWTAKLQITHNSDANIVPAVTRDHNGVLWIVWTKMTGEEKALYFRTDNGQQLSDAARIETGMKSNLAASIIEDGEDQLWLIWSGFDGIDDDIYFSRWNGADWSQPIMINRDDTTPDIQPVSGIGNDGLPWVRWSGFDQGTYKQFESRWNGVAWEPEREIEQVETAPDAPLATLALPSAQGSPATALEQAPAADAGRSTPAGTPDAPVLQLPEFIKSPKKAGIFILTPEGRSVSAPVRTLLPKKDAP